jgi:hypothetical protein
MSLQHRDIPIFSRRISLVGLFALFSVFRLVLRCIIPYRPTSAKLYVLWFRLSALYSQILQYARITQSRITTSFFVFSLFYCCAQIILQFLIFSFDSKYFSLLSGIITSGDLPPANFTFLQGNKGHMHLQVCDEIPFGRVHPCTTIYDSTWDSNLDNLYAPQVLDSWEKGLTVTSIRSSLNATQVIDVRIETRDGSTVFLSKQCIEILLYPYQLYAHYSHSDFYYSYLAMLDYESSKTKTLPACGSKSGSWASPSSLCCTVRYLTRKYDNFNTHQ